MSDFIKHECGIALIHLKKPLSFFKEKYGTVLYGIDKMFLMLQKQHNRGQDGAGFATVKLGMSPGERYISRIRSNGDQPIQEIFRKINKKINLISKDEPKLLEDIGLFKKKIPCSGELLLGHVRYGTYGKNSIENVQPLLRQNNWMHRNLILAGNFNLTNVNELFSELIAYGQHPKERSDTITIMEKIGHFLDSSVAKIYRTLKSEGYTKSDASPQIAKRFNMKKVLYKASKNWDGGYVIAGLLGHGDSFVLRDPSGIRPAFYHENDEFLVVASERPVIQTVFNVSLKSIKELEPGHAILTKKSGAVSIEKIQEPLTKKQCSFERIYFSRGSDRDIYKERKQLGKNVVPQVLKSIDSDLKNSVFSFIPNTAETSFYGMMKGMQEVLNGIKLDKIKALGDNPTDEQLQEILALRNRMEKIAIKDAKLRTFITQDDSRDDLVAHVYDITYGSVYPTDNLVIIDDSIVRGTTLKKSILRILDRLNPKKIVVVSSAPQIRYLDCYGIDMAKMGDFIAFQAAIALLKDQGKEHIIEETYQKCKAQENLPKEQINNNVKDIYAPFTAEEISKKISELLTPKNINAEIDIVYQSIEGLHAACPDHKGDWYFTGNYPTPGGNQVINRAFIYYVEGIDKRAY